MRASVVLGEAAQSGLAREFCPPEIPSDSAWPSALLSSVAALVDEKPPRASRFPTASWPLMTRMTSTSPASSTGCAALQCRLCVSARSCMRAWCGSTKHHPLGAILVISTSTGSSPHAQCIGGRRARRYPKHTTRARFAGSSFLFRLSRCAISLLSALIGDGRRVQVHLPRFGEGG